MEILVEQSRKTNFRVHVFKDVMAVSLIMMKRCFKILIVNVFLEINIRKNNWEKMPKLKQEFC